MHAIGNQTRSRWHTLLVSVLATLFVLSGCRRSRPPEDPGQALVEAAGRSAFDRCDGSDVLEVDLLPALSALPEMTPKEFDEQLRDMVALGLATSPMLGMSTHELAIATATRPLLRSESAGSLLVAQDGPGRSFPRPRDAGDELVVLVPIDQAEPRGETVHTEYRRYLADGGALPTQIGVYGYAIDPALARGWVCKTGAVASPQTFGRASELVTATIEAPEDLDAFLAHNPQLISASCEEGVLTVEGLPQASADSSVSREDVGTIVLGAISAAVWHASGAPDNVPGISFSLDPAHPSLADDLEALRDPLKVKALYEDYIKTYVENPEEVAQLIAQLEKKSFAPHALALSALANDVRARGKEGLPTMPASQEDELAAEVAALAIHQGTLSAVQCPTDGGLRGTDVWSILFYTDLGAKAYDWGLMSVPGLTPSTSDDLLSDLECATDQGAVSGRLWLAINEAAIRLDAHRSRIELDRWATRLFSAVSVPGAGVSETDSPADWDRFNRQFNTYYDRVAERDHPYGRLNEILKWSTVTTWLFDRSQAHPATCLAPLLETIEENPRRQEFRGWLEQHPEYPQQQFQLEQTRTSVTAAQCFPLAVSKPFNRCGETFVAMSGGVSGTSRRQVAAIASRSNSPVGQLQTSGTKVVSKSANHIEIQATSPGAISATIKTQGSKTVAQRQQTKRELAGDTSTIRRELGVAKLTDPGAAPKVTLESSNAVEKAVLPSGQALPRASSIELHVSAMTDTKVTLALGEGSPGLGRGPPPPSDGSVLRPAWDALEAGKIDVAARKLIAVDLRLIPKDELVVHATLSARIAADTRLPPRKLDAVRRHSFASNNESMARLENPIHQHTLAANERPTGRLLTAVPGRGLVDESEHLTKAFPDGGFAPPASATARPLIEARVMPVPKTAKPPFCAPDREDEPRLVDGIVMPSTDELRDDPIHWTEYVQRRIYATPDDAPRLATVVYACDQDGDASVTCDEWLVCRCDADLDGFLSEAHAAEQECRDHFAAECRP